MAEARSEGKLFVEAFLFKSGCWIRLLASRVQLRHGDAKVGSPE